jgi:hypothetical protein
MTARRLELEALMNDIGIGYLTDFIVGCGHLGHALDELTPAQRARVRARLMEAAAEQEKPLPYAARLLLETVANGLEKQAITSINLPAFGNAPHLPPHRVQTEDRLFLRMQTIAQKLGDRQE